jgi:hypothetical protein
MNMSRSNVHHSSPSSLLDWAASVMCGSYINVMKKRYATSPPIHSEVLLPYSEPTLRGNLPALLFGNLI